jgi:hypothetical protein
VCVLEHLRQFPAKLCVIAARRVEKCAAFMNRQRSRVVIQPLEPIPPLGHDSG